MLSSRRGQAIDLNPLVVVRDGPLGGDPFLSFQPVQGRIERAGINLKHLAGVDPDRLADPVAMLRTSLQRLENEQIERPLQQLDPVLIATFH